MPWYGKIFEWTSIQTYRLLKLGSGAFIFCTRDAFEKTGGFDQSLYCMEEAVMSKALGRCGRFHVLRESVVTSGRKLRMYSFWDLAKTMIGIVLLWGKRGKNQASSIGTKASVNSLAFGESEE